MVIPKLLRALPKSSLRFRDWDGNSVSLQDDLILGPLLWKRIFNLRNAFFKF